MEKEIEEQLLKILNKISKGERIKNRALVRQTSRLVRALFYMKAALADQKTLAGSLA